MSDGFMDFSFDSGDSNIGKKTKRFKGKEGETYRLSFVWLQTDEEGNLRTDSPPRFTGAKRFYIQGVGYVLDQGPEYAKIAGGPSKQSVGTIVVKWPTDARGQLDKVAFKEGRGFEVMPWVFSSIMYESLKRRNDEFPLCDHDLSVACTDTQFQKMDLSPCKENLFRKLLEADNDRGKAIAQQIRDQVNKIATTIRDDMAREYTLDQLREKISGTSSSPVGAGASAGDVDGLLDNLLD